MGRLSGRVLPGCAVALIAGLAAGAYGQVDAARSTEPVVRYDGHRVVRVELRTARDLQTVSALTDDIWTHSIPRSGPVDFRVNPEQFVALLRSGMPFQIVIDDVQRVIDAETADIRARAAADDQAWYTNYHNYT